LVVIFGFCLARIYFSYAVAGATLIGILYNMAIMWINKEPFLFAVAHNFFYWGACSLGLLCNYFLEHSSRKEYLQAYLLELRQDDLQKANSKLQELAIVDGLTGIPNRRHFDEVFAHEWRRAQRAGHTVSLLMIDIDFFKKYNDSYGHQAGDDCLIKVANCLRLCLKRPGDLAARYGGEEFVVLLPALDKEGAMALGKVICQQIEAMQIIHEASTVNQFVTVSVGAASTIPSTHNSAEQLLAVADAALYEAKHAGRNQVVVLPA
jgi:diguanylate cyclase (GGDEF)-like protein